VVILTHRWHDLASNSSHSWASANKTESPKGTINRAWPQAHTKGHLPRLLRAPGGSRQT